MTPRSRRVLVVTPHFPPDTSAAGHRMRIVAPYLAAAGWRPTVLAVDPRDSGERADPELAALVPDDLDVVRVRAWCPRRCRRLGFGDLGLRAFSAIFREADRRLRADRFDALLVTLQPNYTALIGPLLKRRHDVAFVLDLQDPWVGEWGRSVGPGARCTPDLRSRVARSVGRLLEPRAIAAADALTAVSAGTWAGAIERAGASAPELRRVLPIGFDQRDHATIASETCSPDLETIVAVGTIAPTGLAVVGAFLRALTELRRELPGLRARFVGTGNGTRGDEPPRVLPLARELGIESAVEEIPTRLDYLDALREQRRAGVLLLLGAPEIHYVASRAFHYLLAGRPVVGLNHERSDVTALLRAAGSAPDVGCVTFGNGVDPADAVAPLVDALRAAVGRGRVARPVAAHDAALAPFRAEQIAAGFAAVLGVACDHARHIRRTARVA